MNFKEELQQKTEQIEQIIMKYIPKQEGYQQTVIEAMNYSLTAGGKRLRPLFMNEVYRMFGGCEDTIEYFMAAMEMIHTYSLVHDDLPAMDNDEYRRGRKTTHIVYGEDMAILAGDGLLNYAFETATAAFDSCKEPALVGKALQILSRKAGIYGMIGGQCVDVETAGKKLSKEKLQFVYRLKTGALLEASFVIGAVLAGASEKECELVEQAAADVGMAFQIQDDILDLTGSTQELGKPAHSDEKNDKTTYAILTGVSQASEEVETLSLCAKKHLAQLDREHEFLDQLIESLINRRK